MVKCFCSACFEPQRMLFLECWSVFVLVVSPSMFETFLFFVHYFWNECEASTCFTENRHLFFGCCFFEGGGSRSTPFRRCDERYEVVSAGLGVVCKEALRLCLAWSEQMCMQFCP